MGELIPLLTFFGLIALGLYAWRDFILALRKLEQYNDTDTRLLRTTYHSELIKAQEDYARALNELQDYKEKRKEHSKFVEEVIYGDD